MKPTVIILLAFTTTLFAQSPYDDHQNMMDQLGVKAIRPGPNPNNQSIFDEASANRYANTLPDIFTMKDGEKVTRADQWPKRRSEILEDFEREIYGRIPANVPAVTWEITATTHGQSGSIPTVTKTLVGHVDNSVYPQLSVNIQASFTVPDGATQPVPLMVAFSGFGFGPRRGALRPTTGPFAFRPPAGPTWMDQAISRGWGYATINPASIQPDNNQLLTGIIGLTNHGQPRTPDQWGALRAWQWGVSRLVDYFESHPQTMVDAKKIGIEGLSRYGKAAIVTEAFDPRIAVGLIGSSGEGGVKLHRHIFGEAVENLAGGEYYWMAGNFIKYGASDPPKTAADLPVDSHELIALCAPRPCFISYGVVEHGDAKWVDAHGSFMSAVLASPVYELLSARGLFTDPNDRRGHFSDHVPANYLTTPMPPVGELIGGELAWRQHDGGHDVTPNWPAFFSWVSRYIQAPSLPASTTNASDPTSGLAASRARRDPSEQNADAPIPRTDHNSQLAHEQLLQKARAGHIDIYFEGDSITRRWGCSDLQYADLYANWKKNFFGWNAADFGWGGDQTQNILWRVDHGELDRVNPKIIVLLAGTNNVGNTPGGESKIENITRGLRAVIDRCRQKAPAAVIVVTAIFPRNDNIAVMPEISRINQNLAKLADGKNIRYLNINNKLANPGGKLFDGMMNADGLHPAVNAYQIWADALKPIFQEVLGPPASTDIAPSPTGDPSQG
jgi:lysophospholipase L1-like esterase